MRRRLSVLRCNCWINRKFGATMHHIKRAALDQVITVVAPQSSRAKFDATVAPMHEHLIVLTKRVSNLRRTRDLLLPRLLSGQITLASAEPDPASSRAAGMPALV